MTEKLDLSKYTGPMTVVGYPDLSWKPDQAASGSPKIETVFHAPSEHATRKPRRQPKHR